MHLSSFRCVLFLESSYFTSWNFTSTTCFLFFRDNETSQWLKNDFFLLRDTLFLDVFYCQSFLHYGANLTLSEAKTEIYFSLISADWFIRRVVYY